MLNKVFLVGNLGADPELIHKDTEHARCTFTVATPEVKRQADGNLSRVPAWHNIVAFGRTAQFAGENLHKGRQVLIEGKLQSRRWEDKSGMKHSAYEVIANAVYPLGIRQGRATVDTNEELDDGLPQEGAEEALAAL